MKAVFLYSRIEENLEESGEAKKAIMQVNALSKLGIKSEIIWHDRTSKYNKILVRIPFYKNYSKKLTNQIIKKIVNDREICLLYIRKDIFDYSFLKMIERIKNETNINILVEIPTYPYDAEWRRMKDLPMLIKDKLARKKIYKYIDRIVLCIPGETKLWGIPTLIIGNGIDVDRINKKEIFSNDASTIKLIGVACVEEWHGYDRLIKGMAEYYSVSHGGRRIEFHIVGNGSQIPYLKRLTEKHDLQEYIIFHGPLYGKQLDDIFDECDIGVASLAAFRKGITVGRELKLREYIARGLPYIYTNDDDIENIPYNCGIKLPRSEQAIDIWSVIEFFDCMREEYDMKQLSMYLRQYAEENLSWEKQISPVAEWVENNVK